MTYLKKQIALLFLIAFASYASVFGQELYPGDVNNNGKANAVDLLFLGVAYGSTGPERDDEDTDWEPQTITTPWGQSFPGGLNYAYADCDGDGVVDDEDIDDAIVENFGQEHGTVLSDSFNISGDPAGSPILRLEPSSLFSNSGEIIIIDVILGSAEIPVQDFYGLAFSMTFDADLTQEEDETTFDLANNAWVDPTNGSLSRSIAVFEDNGHAEIGITRINQQTIDEGFGVIGSFSIVIEDDIASMEIDTLNITIDSIKLIGLDMQSTAMYPRDTFILITSDTTLNTSTIEQRPLVSLFPNPANDYVQIESATPFKKITIHNTIGQRIYTQHFPTSRLSQKLNLTHQPMPNGVYILSLDTGEGILAKPFIVNH